MRNTKLREFRASLKDKLPTEEWLAYLIVAMHKAGWKAGALAARLDPKIGAGYSAPEQVKEQGREEEADIHFEILEVFKTKE
jgi:hypothetical protein